MRNKVKCTCSVTILKESTTVILMNDLEVNFRIKQKIRAFFNLNGYREKKYNAVNVYLCQLYFAMVSLSHQLKISPFRDLQ